MTGELRLCMQVIATAGMEQTRYGTNLLERENRFKELMQMFDRLDQIVYPLPQRSARKKRMPSF